MKLWGGRFTKETNQLVHNFNASLSFDQRFYKQDIEGSLCQEQQLTLQGNTKYEIKYTREKTYNINYDYYVGFRAKYIVNKLRVCLDLPNEIDAIFTCRGTQNEFDDISNNDNRIEKKYRGLVLPRQGYIFALKRKGI